MIIGIPTPLPPSIKACSSHLQASLQVPKSHQSLMLQEPWFIPLRPNPSKEIVVETSEERGLSYPWQASSRRVPLATLRRRIQRQGYGCILLWLINDKWLLVMVPLLLFIMMMSYVFSDWHIVAYTGFYACVCYVSCVRKCPVTDIVRIVICRS